MKERIVKYIEKHPGTRRRYIADDLKIWLCDKAFLDAMRDLEQEKIIYTVVYRNSANLEYYNKYYLVK